MSNPIISMSKLGQMGRFANQVIQYMFLKTYAWQHDLEVRTPRWIGQELFGFDDPPIQSPLPEFVELYDKDPERMVIPMLSRPIKNVDVSGFFQYPSSYYAPFQQQIRSLFTPVAPIKHELDEAVLQLRQRGKTVIGLHLRRGDYGYDYFYITPTAWYLRWLEVIWPRLDDPVLFIASDDLPQVLPDFRDYQPVTSKELGVHLPKAPYYPDFYFLSQADYLAIPNSSFSFVAAMLNEHLEAAYRSHLRDPLDKVPFRRFDPWDALMLDCEAAAERFSAIEGITRRHKRKLFFSRWVRTLLKKAA